MLGRIGRDKMRGSGQAQNIMGIKSGIFGLAAGVPASSIGFVGSLQAGLLSRLGSRK